MLHREEERMRMRERERKKKGEEDPHSITENKEGGGGVQRKECRMRFCSYMLCVRCSVCNMAAGYAVFFITRSPGAIDFAPAPCLCII